MINLICKDLRDEEICIQIANCFENLETISKQSFSKINQKLENLSKNLNDIQESQERVKFKINKLKEEKKKATKVFSSLNYPAKDIYKNHIYEPLLKLDQEIKPKIFNENITQPHTIFYESLLKEKLSYFDLDLFLRSKKHTFKNYKTEKNIPWNRITSVSSFLVFNSSENAYFKNAQDTFVFEYNKTKNKKGNTEDILNFNYVPQPDSILKKDNQTYSQPFDYEQLDIPQVLNNLPSDLPNLDAVAEDLEFNSQISSNFDSSFIKVDNHKNEEKEKDFKPCIVQVSECKNFNLENIENILNTVPIKETNDTEIIDSKNLNSITVPPPPPLPHQSIKKEKEDHIVENAKICVIENNPRASLLDAIRKAGGKPKKKKITIKEKKIEERKIRKEAVAIDLISNLKQHLLSRRQAMVGKSNIMDTVKNSKTHLNIETSGNVFESLNRMLPSPTLSINSSDSEKSDEWIN